MLALEGCVAAFKVRRMACVGDGGLCLNFTYAGWRPCWRWRIELQRYVYWSDHTGSGGLLLKFMYYGCIMLVVEGCVIALCMLDGSCWRWRVELQFYVHWMANVRSGGLCFSSLCAGLVMSSTQPVTVEHERLIEWPSQLRWPTGAWCVRRLLV